MWGRSSHVQRLLKNGQKSDSFTSNFERHFKSTTSRTDLRKCMNFQAVNKLTQIVSMKKFTNLTAAYVWSYV